MRNKMTLEKLLAKTRDCVLLDIHLEIKSGVVPTKGCAHTYVRKINRMIDRGDMCINQTTYRKVYLPTLAKAVQKELADRYAAQIIFQMRQTDTEAYEQTVLNLVGNKQVQREDV